MENLDDVSSSNANTKNEIENVCNCFMCLARFIYSNNRPVSFVCLVLELGTGKLKNIDFYCGRLTLDLVRK